MSNAIADEKPLPFHHHPNIIPVHNPVKRPKDGETL